MKIYRLRESKTIQQRDLHPSYAGRLSLVASSASDPGMSGTLTPFIEEFGEPDIIFNVYKNRDGEVPMFKIFAKLDLGTFEFEELFITDWMYRPFRFTKIAPVNLVCEQPNIDYDETTGEVKEEQPKKSRRR